MKSLLFKAAIKVKNHPFFKKVLKRLDDKEKQLKAESIPPVVIKNSTKVLIEELKGKAKLIYGDNWNFYSDALNTDIVKNFEETIDILEKTGKPVKYLEIGSAQGLSMALIGSVLKDKKIAGSLVSLDPYFEDGYVEGAESPWKTANLIAINKSTKQNAAKLYVDAGINVTQVEKTSFDGLIEYTNKQEKFDYIYIDGYHEKFVPMQDLALCLPLLNIGGIIMLDDHTGWPDVTFLKYICDKYLTKVSESWKIVAYQKNQEF